MDILHILIMVLIELERYESLQSRARSARANTVGRDEPVEERIHSLSEIFFERQCDSLLYSRFASTKFCLSDETRTGREISPSGGSPPIKLDGATM